MAKLEIDAQSWAEIDRLLDEALERPMTERDAWLATLPPQFERLKPPLRELLSRAAAVETSDFLGTLPRFEAGPEDAAEPASAERPGAEIGPYRLIREIARGGMGTVWLAERVDGLFSRRVALKLPHGPAHHAGLVERMARERAILATLEHPNIARLYDAGVTPDGQPYIALEYVEGRPIDVHCGAPGEAGALELRARLDLFVQAAHAVAYAHDRQIIHRDIKPANIFVTAGGEVRLLDFGIAKILDSGEAHDTRLTQLGGHALTPDYASPEQILGEPLTVASDVYSLGVLLYELLTGSRPYRLERSSRGALEEAILNVEPAPPSESATHSACRDLRGDLDTIVLKALKKRPAERYASVVALVDDVTRYLQGRPVLAQPDSRWYRLRKLVARNRAAVATGSGVLLAALAVAGLWFLALPNDFGGAPPPAESRIGVLPVQNDTGDASLDWARFGLMSMTSQQLRAAGLKVVDDREVVERVTAAEQRDGPPGPWLAQALRQTDGATHLLEARLEHDGSQYRLHTSLTDARGMTRTWTFADTDPLGATRHAAAAIIMAFDAEAESISADTFVNEAYARGRALLLQGRCEEAQALLAAAMAQQPMLVEPRIEFAACARQLGDPTRAEAMLRQVLTEPELGADDLRRARALLELGIVLHRTGRIDEADAAYAESEVLARRLGEEDVVARALVNRGIVEEDRSNFALAREHVAGAVEAFRKASRPVVPGNVYALLANLGIDEGRLDEAEHYYALALESFRAAGDLFDEAMMLNNFGLLRREQGRLDEAEALHRASGEIRERIGDQAGLGRVENMLAQVHAARGRFDESLAASERALAIASETGDRFYEAVTLTSRAEALAGLGRWDDAARDFDRAASLFTAIDNRAYVLQIDLRRARIELEQGQVSAARRRTEAVLIAAREESQAMAEIEALAMLGDVANGRGDRPAAMSHYEEAVEKARTAGHSGAVTEQSIKLAATYLAAGDIAAARPLIDELGRAPETYQVQRLRAAWAASQGDHVLALEQMRRAEAVAGQRWTEADNRLLAGYQQDAAAR